MANEERVKKTVLIEAYACNTRGSEPGIAQRWIDAVVSMPEIDKVLVLTHSPKKPGSVKEEVHLIWLPAFARPLFQVASMLPFSRLWNRLCFYLCYMCWLWKAHLLALHLSKTHQITLALHCTYTNLTFGTFLWRLRKHGIKTASIGVLLFPVPKAFAPYMNGLERFGYMLHQFFNRFLRVMRSTDYVVASTRGTLRYLRKNHEKGQQILNRVDAVFSVKREEKVRRALYVDRPEISRKCGRLLFEALAGNSGSPLPLLILTPNPERWSGLNNVTPSPYLSEADFEAALAASEFVLSTSARESGHSSILRGTTAGTIPILTDIDGYAAIPNDAKLTIKTEGDLLANVLSTLTFAAQLGQEESREMSRKAEQWGATVNSQESLASIVRYMVGNDCSSPHTPPELDWS
jgi:hypothetical protein